MWVWASLKPGIAKAPWRSMTLVFGPFSFRRSASVPAARIFPLAMAIAVTVAGVGEWSLGRRWTPVRILPWMKMVSGGVVWPWVAAVSRRRAFKVRAFTWWSVSGQLWLLLPPAEYYAKFSGLERGALCFADFLRQILIRNEKERFNCSGLAG